MLTLALALDIRKEKIMAQEWLKNQKKPKGNTRNVASDNIRMTHVAK